MHLTKAHKNTFTLLVVFAIVCFVYAVAVLGFRCFFPSKPAQKMNAIALAAIWAIGPPIWFACERWIWGNTENQKELDTAQEHARDFWVGLGAIVLFLADKRFGK